MFSIIQRSCSAAAKGTPLFYDEATGAAPLGGFLTAACLSEKGVFDFFSFD
jgi:hypothetical protein